MRANELMESSEVPKHPKVQEWAQAIQSGKRRTISDIDPVHVERILHESVGGAAAAARLLYTPEVTKLIDRHHTLLSTLHTGLNASARSHERGMARSGRQYVPSKTQSSQHQHTAMLSNPVTAPMIEAPAGQSTQESLESMLATNEEPHLLEQAQQAQMGMVDSGNKAVSGPPTDVNMARNPQAHAGFAKSHHKAPEPRMSGYAVDPPDQEESPRVTITGKNNTAQAQTPTGHAMPPVPQGPPAPTAPTAASPRRQVAAGLTSAPESKREVTGGLSAPPPRSSPTSTMNDDKKERRKDEMRLSGTLTIISKGQTIGEAKMNGMLG